MPPSARRSEAADFWRLADELVATNDLVIDRPSGSAHPRVPDVIYPLDYGFLARTHGGDGEGVDVWRGSLPLLRVTGLITTVDLFKGDAEVKLLIGCTEEEAALALQTHCQGRQRGILIVRPTGV